MSQMMNNSQSISPKHIILLNFNEKFYYIISCKGTELFDEEIPFT